MTRPIMIALLLLPFGSLAATAADDGIIKRPATGCMSKAAMVRAHELREQRDPAAVQLLLSEGLRSGDCRPFAPGEPVIVEDNDILAGISKVHTPGDPQAFWVPDRAVDD